MKELNMAQQHAKKADEEDDVEEEGVGGKKA